MTEVHLPKLDDLEEETTAAPPPVAASHTRRKSAVRFGLEVLLISTGVFLGLMGEQWREHAHTRHLAETSMRRLRTELANNRQALAAVRDYHAGIKARLDAYFRSDRPDRATFDVQTPRGLAPVFFEHTAWDLALATQSLAYMDEALAFDVSRAYTVQQDYADLQRAIVQSTIYGRSPTDDFERYWRAVSAYYGDVAVFDPALLRAYDDALAAIDRELGTNR